VSYTLPESFRIYIKRKKKQKVEDNTKIETNKQNSNEETKRDRSEERM
jgi:hypothetical protein